MEHLPDSLRRLFEEALEPDELFTALMPALGEVLPCDRSFLYLREPVKQHGIITHCWARDGRAADWLGADWLEGANAPPDPLMTLALRTPIAVFVEDIETAGSDVVDRAYERETFRHRALIHAPLYFDEALIGILECSVFDTPRVWSEDDRQLIAHLQAKLMIPAQAYQATLFNM
ncbi:GAF domain-containing protein [Leptolyngbya sp. FACHB-321]|uniref:GAF domain-containing protein n=1 Tax=Leptolyngbya sp. FACHB-321 TaxID=2692807 RepID=UPI00168903DB|nr:GAF domain-containing protein [Leptolyngbya sp. FACHB-321]MBD2035956.1 GAF domain-containing protein [Leptolyngbya sp. FACHB-321]